MDRIYRELKEMRQEYEEKGRGTLLNTSTRHCIRQLIQIIPFNHHNNPERLVKVNIFLISTISTVLSSMKGNVSKDLATKCILTY